MAGDADGVIINQKVRSKKGGSDEKAGQNKKRKASTVVIHQNNNEQGTSDSSTKRRKSDAGTHHEDDLDTSRPTAIFKPKSARSWTVSIALPGSWLNNARKPDHKTLQVGRIARAAAVFSVDEIVIYDDDPSNIDPKVVNDRYIRHGRKANKSKQEILESILEEDEPWQNPDQFLYHVLSFAECPPHLRMRLFPKHKNLEQAGLLPSMDMPHHLKAHEWCQFREGVIVGPAGNGKHDAQVYIDCGLPYPVRVAVPAEAPLEAGMRTTVRFADSEPPASWPHLSQADCDALEASACAPSLPREEGGYYWGYTVRRTSSLSAVFSECDYPGGYDYTIGTSERGVDVRSILPGYTAASGAGVAGPFNHLLLVFGGVAGIEPAVANDPVLAEKGLGKTTAHTLFDAWVNLVPGQGSRTIRTEEAVEFGLCALKPYVDCMYEK